METLISAFATIPALAGLAAVLVLMPVLWMFMPLLGFGTVRPFEDPWSRAVICLLVVVVYLALTYWRVRQRRARDKALTVAAAEPMADRCAEETAALRENLSAALDTLRRSAAKKGAYLYELPWYVLIGPPGSGKTTAIARSGLEFPLAEGKVPGVGGTRHCDWWLSDRAVMLDTAGRYTTQDSDASADKAGWDGFLNLLRRTRPRQPLNGVIVAFGIDLISGLDAEKRAEHARTVRRRIKELEEKLGQRLPVYLLLTKTDLLPGFTETFDDLDREKRNQVWGFTFPAQTGPEGATGRFGAEFQALLARLQERLLERLQAERGPAQRAAIAGFPAQVASLEQPVAAFAQAAFGGTRMDPALFLRGVYFTSATQEGTPIDRLTGALSRTFGLDGRRVAQVSGQQARSFFLGRLLKEVVFREAQLAARDSGAERRRRIAAAGIWGLAIIAMLAGGAWGWTTHAAEQRRAGVMADATAKAEAAAQGIPFDPVTDGELLRALPYLDAARDLPRMAGEPNQNGIGLDQTDKLAAGGRIAYRHALDRTLLPRLLARLEQQLRTSLQRADTLYEATRVYLMLGRQGPLDAGLVRAWLAADFAQAYPGALHQPQREALLRHLDALLTQDFATYPVDGALVDTARRVFSRLPMAERVYSRLRPAGEAVAPWRPADALGAGGGRFFLRASGRPLTDGVPGLYTLDGLQKALLPNLPAAVQAAAGESWVLGPEAGAIGAEDPARLEAAVLALYVHEYGEAWQALLDDLVLPPFAGLPAAAEGLNVLGAPNSPLRDLLRAITRQLAPSAVAERAPPPGGGAAVPTGPAAEVGRLVEARFAALREASGAPLEDILRSISELYVQVARLASLPPGTALPPSAAGALDPGQRLLADAARQPEPLAKWLRALAQSTQQARAGGAKAAIAAVAQQQLAPLCRAVEGRFPLRRDGADVPVDDFTRLFAPGGALDQFFAQNIRPYADTTQNPWRPMATDGLAPPVTAADLAQFQRAQAIRDAFFPGIAGSGLRFELLPQGLDVASNSAVLEADGVRNELPPTGGGRPVLLSWPARGNLTLTFEPAGSAGALTLDGGWSSLRLVMGRQSSLQRLVGERYRVTVSHGDRGAIFELRAGSSVNPFNLAELARFRCPVLAP
ncbi:type VI secretion system membrane subunit TssM [Roseomonas aerophila]|uniref:Type VI secretion system membrane subunit TssM n=1 Tax=Teichococcus aerophilus TaxID=1224513 RepID=A0ABR7RNR5_9PROT|nr:type VI secretion system membrane subunit TssM [Pseudoroseomonas aerophila]MBC9208251.1 type VI secretion system membrane subunit TssM [Pseudoroseomonas aerophila]